MKLPSKLLAIDTATKSIYLALIIDGTVIERIYQEGISNHSVTIMPLINQMLQNHQMDLKMIEGVLIGIGPGSYTGVRIGVAIAKMIGYLNGVPLFKCSSLALLASASHSEFVAPMIDARRGNAFTASLRQSAGVLTYEIYDTLMNVETFRQTLPFVHDEISEGMPDIVKLINSGLFDLVDDVHALVPNYLQITEAERNKAL
jgi:tRNA threonylcarbamoyladenosine biosynthesis protein TsaB